jgi:A/G-specific adenine glycosylase
VTPSQASLRRDLLSWFDRHRRDLPWRRTQDPYRIWVSEIMLQQTRVEAVLPYYERFLARFPSVHELASAPVDDVLALWSGLGYYRRARQLHAAARRIAEAGEFPRTLDRLLELPGIGAYTAAAVASIAFGVAAPVLDGNVERVMARRLALAEDPRRGASRARLLAAAATLLDPSRPGDSNQALMELGATLCLPRQPRCLLCPLRPGCGAAAAGRPELYPPPRRRRPTEIRLLLVAVVASRENPDRVLLFRRSERLAQAAPGTQPPPGLPAGAWELPWLELRDEEAPELAPAPPTRARPAASAAPGEGWPRLRLPPVAAVLDGRSRGLADKYGGDWRLGPALAAVRHGITYRDLRVTICGAELLSAGADEVREGVDSGWFDAAERAALPMSALVGKVLRARAAAAAPGAVARAGRDGAAVRAPAPRHEREREAGR